MVNTPSKSENNKWIKAAIVAGLVALAGAYISKWLTRIIGAG